MEKYVDAAEEIAVQAIVIDELDAVLDRPAARRIVRQLVSRAYRRPAREEDIERLMGLFDLARDGGESFEAAVRLHQDLVDAAFGPR